MDLKYHVRNSLSSGNTICRKKLCYNPEFPANYPAAGVNALIKQKGEIKVKMLGTLTGKEMAILTQNFVNSVLTQTGYFVSDSHNGPVEYLVDATNRFLAIFMFVLRRNKGCTFFSERDDLWGPLESTLHEIGFGGITRVHDFYYDKIVKKHDRLFCECTEELCKYKRQREEVLQYMESLKKTQFRKPSVPLQGLKKPEGVDPIFLIPAVPLFKQPHTS